MEYSMEGDHGTEKRNLEELLMVRHSQYVSSEGRVPGRLEPESREARVSAWYVCFIRRAV